MDCNSNGKIKALMISPKEEAIFKQYLGPDQKVVNEDLQLKEMEAANIPDDTKKKIATEYLRLCRLHPNWKQYKAMRKAGEKYNVKFTFS